MALINFITVKTKKLIISLTFQKSIYLIIKQNFKGYIKFKILIKIQLFFFCSYFNLQRHLRAKKEN